MAHFKMLTIFSIAIILAISIEQGTLNLSQFCWKVRFMGFLLNTINN